MSEFSNWLLVEIESRKWGVPDLARAAHVTRGAIGNVLRGERGPGTELCTAIARAFKLPPEVVFRKAGILPPVPKENIKVEELNEIARHLKETELDDLLGYARFRTGFQEEREKK